MKRQAIIFSILLLIPFQSSRAAGPDESARASMKAAPTVEVAASPEYQQTLRDIKETLGLVPTFFQSYPQNALPGAWALFKGVQLNPNSAIPPKYKELIGLAVAAQIPCRYCQYFHTTGAKMHGASAEEINEAVALGALDRQWATFLTGTEADEGRFRGEVDQIMNKIRGDREKSGGNPPAQLSNLNFNTPEEAYNDMQQTLGIVPEFIRRFPRSGVAGAWKQTKPLLFGADAAIPAKYRDLVSLAVSSQIPCPNCVYFDTASARLDGATEDEINEAVTMSSIVRNWSTVLNGTQPDEAKFKREVNQVFANAKKRR